MVMSFYSRAEIRRLIYLGIKGTLSRMNSCFHDYLQELALSLVLS